MDRRQSGGRARSQLDQGTWQLASTLPWLVGLGVRESGGRELRDKIELWLAWQRVGQEVAEGVLGSEYDRAERSEIQARVREAREAAKDEVWASYRYVALANTQERNGLKIIDLGAGHASASQTLSGRIVGALKSEALLNENVGAGYIDRHWPPAFKDAGAWPLTSLRQSFLNGTLTRLVDPDAILQRQIVEFVSKGDFGFASGAREDGSYERLWYTEPIRAEEIGFEADVYLLTQDRAAALKAVPGVHPPPQEKAPPSQEPAPQPQPKSGPAPGPPAGETTLRIAGTLPPEVWNRLGTTLVPKLRSGSDLRVGVEFSVRVNSEVAQSLEAELRQVIGDLDLGERVRIERS